LENSVEHCFVKVEAVFPQHFLEFFAKSSRAVMLGLISNVGDCRARAQRGSEGKRRSPPKQFFHSFCLR
jgi:hypothetical protein